MKERRGLALGRTLLIITISNHCFFFLSLASCFLLLSSCFLLFFRLLLASCFLLRASCFLLLASCFKFLLLASCFVLLASCFVLLASSLAGFFLCIGKTDLGNRSHRVTMSHESPQWHGESGRPSRPVSQWTVRPRGPRWQALELYKKNRPMWSVDPYTHTAVAYSTM